MRLVRVRIGSIASLQVLRDRGELLDRRPHLKKHRHQDRHLQKDGDRRDHDECFDPARHELLGC